MGQIFYHDRDYLPLDLHELVSWAAPNINHLLKLSSPIPDCWVISDSSITLLCAKYMNSVPI